MEVRSNSIHRNKEPEVICCSARNGVQSRELNRSDSASVNTGVYREVNRSISCCLTVANTLKAEQLVNRSRERGSVDELPLVHSNGVSINLEQTRNLLCITKRIKSKVYITREAWVTRESLTRPRRSSCSSSCNELLSKNKVLFTSSSNGKVAGELVNHVKVARLAKSFPRQTSADTLLVTQCHACRRRCEFNSGVLGILGNDGQSTNGVCASIYILESRSVDNKVTKLVLRVELKLLLNCNLVPNSRLNSILRKELDIDCGLKKCGDIRSRDAFLKSYASANISLFGGKVKLRSFHLTLRSVLFNASNRIFYESNLVRHYQYP